MMNPKKQMSLLVCVVFALVRALTLMASLELSDASDAATVLVAGGEDCSECPFEREGQECPPGCPNCHCSHSNVSLAPASENALATAAMLDERLEVAPYEAAIPRAPPSPGVYRPPRSAPTRS